MIEIVILALFADTFLLIFPGLLTSFECDGWMSNVGEWMFKIGMILLWVICVFFVIMFARYVLGR